MRSEVDQRIIDREVEACRDLHKGMQRRWKYAVSKEALYTSLAISVVCALAVGAAGAVILADFWMGALAGAFSLVLMAFEAIYAREQLLSEGPPCPWESEASTTYKPTYKPINRPGGVPIDDRGGVPGA